MVKKRAFSLAEQTRKEFSRVLKNKANIKGNCKCGKVLIAGPDCKQTLSVESDVIIGMLQP